MTAIANIETGEIVALCSPDEARRLTDEIKGAAESLWSLLAEAHDRQAWAALGYVSFSDYATAEFGMSKVHAYRLLGQAEVIREIEAATGVTHGLLNVSEREARDVKPRLKAVTDSIKERLTEEADAPEPDRIEAVVAEVIAEQREIVKQENEDRRALKELSDSAIKAGVDPDLDRTRQRGEFSRLCKHLAELPAASGFITRHGSYLTERHVAQAERAYAWLDEFLIEMREAK